MLLEITHDTHYSYDPSVEIAQHFAHLKPATLGSQQVLKTEIQVDPQPAWREENTDHYGNICTFFSLQNRHSELTITAKSLIQTSGNVGLSPKPEDTPPWEAVREYFRYHSKTKWDAASEFLFTSPFIALQPEFAEFARANFTTGRPILEAAIDLTQRIYGEFHYVSKSTDIGTPALEALNKREGVCQDFAHVLLQLLRTAGIPSRYVSGYICPNESGLRGEGATHAWVEIYSPKQGWLGLDPTNNIWTMENHVKLSVGRNFTDCTPVKGTFKGLAKQTLSVSVSIGYEDGRQFEEINNVLLEVVSTQLQEQLDYIENMQQQQQ